MNLEDTIKNLPEREAPAALKRKTMRKILVIRYRPYLYLALVLLIANLVMSANYFYSYIASSAAWEAIRAFIQGSDWNFSYLSNFWLAVKELMPLDMFLVVLISFVSVIHLIVFFQHYRRELLKI